MNILYIHQYFFTPERDGRLRSYHLAKALVAAGHRVQLITSHNNPVYQKSEIEGITVHYLPIFYDNTLGKWQRIFAFARFVWQCYKIARKQKADICFATSTPLSVGIIALALKKFHGIPYIFEVRDLWPEAPIQLGFFKNPLYKTILYALEKYIYREAEKVVALSPSMAAGVRNVSSTTEVIEIPNMADTDFYALTAQKPEAVLSQYHLQNILTVSYIGTIGKANAVGKFIDLAEWWQKNAPYPAQFLVVGEGAELESLRQRVLVQKLSNVKILGHKNRYEVRDLWAVTDFAYISFADFPVLETNSPNKFFDAIAAGVPCLTNIKGWIADEIAAAECGFYTDPAQPQQTFEQVNLLVQNPDLYQLARKKARHLAENKFSKKQATQKFVALFSVPQRNHQ